jgi:hypothetical protein
VLILFDFKFSNSVSVDYAGVAARFPGSVGTAGVRREKSVRPAFPKLPEKAQPRVFLPEHK